MIGCFIQIPLFVGRDSRENLGDSFGLPCTYFGLLKTLWCGLPIPWEYLRNWVRRLIIEMLQNLKTLWCPLCVSAFFTSKCLIIYSGSHFLWALLYCFIVFCFVYFLVSGTIVHYALCVCVWMCVCVCGVWCVYLCNFTTYL